MDLKVFKNGKKVKLTKYTFVNEYKGSRKPDTGDTTNMIVPAAIFAAAVIALIAMLIKRRKNKDDDK